MFESVDLALIAQESGRFQAADYWRDFFANQKRLRERRASLDRHLQQQQRLADEAMESIYGHGYVEYCRLNYPAEEEIVDWAKEGF